MRLCRNRWPSPRSAEVFIMLPFASAAGHPNSPHNHTHGDRRPFGSSTANIFSPTGTALPSAPRRRLCSLTVRNRRAPGVLPNSRSSGSDYVDRRLNHDRTGPGSSPPLPSRVAAELSWKYGSLLRSCAADPSRIVRMARVPACQSWLLAPLMIGARSGAAEASIDAPTVISSKRRGFLRR